MNHSKEGKKRKENNNGMKCDAEREMMKQLPKIDDRWRHCASPINETRIKAHRTAGINSKEMISAFPSSPWASYIHGNSNDDNNHDNNNSNNNNQSDGRGLATRRWGMTNGGRKLAPS